MRQLRVPAELGLRFLGICPQRLLLPVDGCEFGQVECVGRKARRTPLAGELAGAAGLRGLPLGLGHC